MLYGPMAISEFRPISHNFHSHVFDDVIYNAPINVLDAFERFEIFLFNQMQPFIDNL